MSATATDLPRSFALLLPLLLIASPAAADERDAARVDPRITSLIAALDNSEADLTDVRLLKAATQSGGHAAWLRARTERHGADIRIDVLDEHGSGSTRKRVLHGVLESEMQPSRRRLSAVDHTNYRFRIEHEGPDGYAVRLLPKRSDKRLIDGVVWVDRDGHPTRMQGQLAKSPSFWVRSVTVITQYAQINGATLPVSVESLADVRFFGLSVFSMRYAYETVNARPVRRHSELTSGTPEPPAPSPSILALHAAWKAGAR